MIPLNTKPILDCNEEETEIHFKEIESIFEKLSTDDNFCIIEVSYSDPIQIIDKCRRIIKMKLSEIEEFIQNFDIKNGTDIYNNEKNLVFILYGQNYNYDGQNYITTTQLYAKKV
jgi:hypothetical protein fgonA2_02259